MADNLPNLIFTITPTVTHPSHGTSSRTDYWINSGNTGTTGYTGPAPTQVLSDPAPHPAPQQSVNKPLTVAAMDSPAYTIPPLPTNTPKSGLDAVPVLGAICLCCGIFMFRKTRN